MKDLQAKSLDDLQGLSRELSATIFSIRTQFSITKKLDKPHLLRSCKKERARVMTVMNQKMRGKNVSNFG